MTDIELDDDVDQTEDIAPDVRNDPYPLQADDPPQVAGDEG